MKTLIVILGILSTGAIIGLSINCDVLIAHSTTTGEAANACPYSISKTDPFETYQISTPEPKH
tara:strand:- start:740 stop:928 length:189 start_codon:yes stop_codon:yes gene_type:complete